jgi:hypothetical protein
VTPARFAAFSRKHRLREDVSLSKMVGWEGESGSKKRVGEPFVFFFFNKILSSSGFDRVVLMIFLDHSHKILHSYQLGRLSLCYTNQTQFTSLISSDKSGEKCVSLNSKSVSAILPFLSF